MFIHWILECVVHVTVYVWLVLDACQYMSNGTSFTPCQNDAICVNGTRPDMPGSFTCVCAVGFTGQFCEQGLTYLSTNSLFQYIASHSA